MAKKNKNNNSNKDTDNSKRMTTAEDEDGGGAVVHHDTIVEVVEEEMELLQIDLGDMIKVKQVLDEGVASALLEQEHLPEDYQWDNCKLMVMFVACCFAMMAQFAPMPFPDSRPILGVCGTMYFVLSGVLQLMTIFIDKDAILWTRPMKTVTNTTTTTTTTVDGKDEKKETKHQNQDLTKYGLCVRSTLERYTEWYTVTIEFQQDKKETNKGPTRAVYQKYSIGQFFDKEGYFDEVGLTMEIEKLFKRFDQGKYNAPEESTKNKLE